MITNVQYFAPVQENPNGITAQFLLESEIKNFTQLEEILREFGSDTVVSNDSLR